MMKILNALTNRLSLYSVLLIISFIVAVPAYAVEKKLKFNWTFTEHLDDVINGFHIYWTNEDNDPRIIASIEEGSVRTATRIVDLPYGMNCFFMAPYIGEIIGEPSDIGCVDVPPLSTEKITNFTVEIVE